MLRVTASTDDRPMSSLAPGDDDLVERIVAEYEPIVARTRRAMAGIWHDRKVSKTTLFTLMQVDMHGPLPMSRLAAHLGVGLSNMTGIVTRMEEHGLVERVRDDRDRRIVLVRATARGSETLGELEAIRRQHLRLLVTGLDPSDRQACLQAFRALREAAERLDRDDQAIDPPPSGPLDRPPQGASN
jgi:DNA-binding MarR family transcriptional regulator